MKILHVLDHSLPLQSGYVYRTLGILDQQRALGLETIQLTTPRHKVDGPSPEVMNGFKFHRTRCASSSLASVPVFRELSEIRATVGRLGSLCASERPDVIHAHSPLLNVFPALATRWRLNIPVVYEVRALWEDAAVTAGDCTEASLRYRASKQLETWALRGTDAIVTISQGLKSEIVSRGIPAEKVTVVPNAVDPNSFAETSVDPQLAQRLGTDGAFVLGYIGSFYSYEGLDLLLEALPRIRADGRDVRLVLVGGGPEEDSLRRMAENLDLGEAVNFVGRIPHEEVGKYYSLMNLAVYPRRSARLTELVTPLKPLEAMAMSVPVVASDIGGHRELIEHDRTGLLFPPESMNELVNVVLRCMDEPDLGPRLVHRAHEFVMETRSWAAVASAYVDLYEALSS